MAKLEKLEKDKIEHKKDYSNRIEQETNGPIKKYETLWSVWKGYRQ